MAFPLVAGVTVSVVATATPATAGDGVKAENVMVGAELTVTVTLLVGAPVVVVPDVVATPAAAVTFVVFPVVSVVWATPDAFVVTVEKFSEPASVVNDTGIPDSVLPPPSFTTAVITDEPPVAGNERGEAVSAIEPTAAAPIAIFSEPAAPTDTPPEDAVIVAVPDVPFATNCVAARPLTSVSTDGG